MLAGGPTLAMRSLRLLREHGLHAMTRARVNQAEVNMSTLVQIPQGKKDFPPTVRPRRTAGLHLARGLGLGRKA